MITVCIMVEFSHSLFGLAGCPDYVQTHCETKAYLKITIAAVTKHNTVSQNLKIRFDTQPYLVQDGA